MGGGDALVGFSGGGVDADDGVGGCDTGDCGAGGIGTANGSGAGVRRRGRVAGNEIAALVAMLNRRKEYPEEVVQAALRAAVSGGIATRSCQVCEKGEAFDTFLIHCDMCGAQVRSQPLASQPTHDAHDLSSTR